MDLGMRRVPRTRLVVGGGMLLVLVQLGVRAWVLYPSWFFLDDYNLLNDATGQRLTLDYLLSPYNSHLMPAGRLVAWLVAGSGPVDWGLAASVTLLLQALSGGAALWCLLTLFGARWGTLGALSVYLSSAITVPAMVWWAAALTLVPLQAVMFAAVGTWVCYHRSRRRRWLLVTLGLVVVGMLFDVKALLVPPVLAFLSVAYFAEGSLLERTRTVLRRDRRAVAAAALVVGAYVAYYLTRVHQPLATSRAAGQVAELADTMLGTAFVSGVLGGPWRWSSPAPPTALAHPPDWAVHLCWVVVVLVVAYGALRRHGTWRAWMLLAGYLLALLGLLASSRGRTFGGVIGLEYRYLTDSAAVVALCVGLAFLPLAGAVQPSEARERPLLLLRFPDAAAVALVVLVTVSGLVSTVRYAGIWHSDNASDAYVHRLADDLRTQGAVDLADQVVPDDVMSSLAAPDNTVRRMTSLLSDRVSYPDTTARLAVAAPDGTLHQALIKPGVVSKDGPRQDCGWLVRGGGRDIPLEGRAFDWSWWVRIGYLASHGSPVRVSAGRTQVSSTLDRGVHSLFVKVDGTFDHVRLDGLRPGTTLCVDTVEVGQPAPGPRLP